MIDLGSLVVVSGIAAGVSVVSAGWAMIYEKICKHTPEDRSARVEVRVAGERAMTLESPKDVDDLSARLKSKIHHYAA